MHTPLHPVFPEILLRDRHSFTQHAFIGYLLNVRHVGPEKQLYLDFSLPEKFRFEE